MMDSLLLCHAVPAHTSQWYIIAVSFFQSVYWAENAWPSLLVLTKTDVNAHDLARQDKDIAALCVCVQLNLLWMSKGIEFCEAATGVCWKYGTEYKPYNPLLLLPISWFYCLLCFEERSLAASLVFYHFIAWSHELLCCQMLLHFERDVIRCNSLKRLKNW